MRVLFDHNVPRRLRALLPGHSIRTAREMAWDALKNGELLASAEAAGFDVLVTGDKNLSYQQSLAGRQLSLIVLSTTDWNTIQRGSARIASALAAVVPGSFQTVALAQQPASRYPSPHGPF